MKKILVIEDDRILRENIAELLEISGYAVETAGNGLEGVDRAKKTPVDLILCDIKMPGLDGYGVLHILRKNPRTATTPFIFLTAKTERGDQRKGMEMGADDFITKPYESTELLNAIETRLERKEVFNQVPDENAGKVEYFFNEPRNRIGLQGLAEKSEARNYSPQEQVFREGDNPYFLFFVEEGSIKTSRINSDGKIFISNIYSVGDFFGVQPLIEDRTYRETAEALEESIVRYIPKKEFLDILQKNKEVAGNLIEMMSRELTEKDEQIIRIAYDSVRKRVALKLLELIPPGEKAATDLSRTNLASLLGTTTETIVRILSEFREQKIIATEGKHLTLTDREKLKELLRNW